MAQMAAGVRAEFVTDAQEIHLPISVEPEADEKGAPYVVDLTVDDVRTRIEATGICQIRHELPTGEHTVRLWLPQAGYTAVGAVELRGADSLRPLRRRPRWTTYGSSITQCHSAPGPSQTWPALAATALDWDLTCLGMSGQCHLDPIALRAITETPADVITLCLGINIYNAASFSGRTFSAQVSDFIERVRCAHPGVPIAVISPIGSADREAVPNAVGMTLEDYREALHEVIGTLKRDDEALALIDGTDILTVAEGHLLPDGLHPEAEGYRLMAQRLASRLTGLA